jgi:DNA-directed RNA polymerase specialized sigma24 family protein
MTKKIPKKKNQQTNLPHNVSNEEFIRVLDNISKRLGHKFRFGYHDFEDMKQQAAIFALEGLEKYDNTKPLENFLWTHVRNRLFNYKRNNYQRPDKPCLNCPFFDKSYKCSNNQCSEFTNKSDCGLYAAWASRNEAKKNIMQPSYIEHDLLQKKHDDLSSDIQNKEIIDYLDSEVSLEHRENYLKLKHGDKIPKQQLLKLQKYIAELMENFKCKMDQRQKNEDN